MRTDPQLLEIAKGDRGMIRGIEACIERQCLISAIALIFASLDSISALTRPNGQADTTSKQFIEWVDRFLLPHAGLKCTSEELYAARCGVLHTHSPESNIQRRSNGTVKRLVYQWRSGPAADAEIALPNDATTIVVEDLFDSFTNAVDGFLGEVEQDSNLADVVNSHLAELLCYRPHEVVTVNVVA